MNKKFRIIPRLEIKNNFLIKGMYMEGLKKIGNPIIFAREYSKKKFHELFYEDIVASLYNRNIDLGLINKISKNINIPLTVCGGIKNIDQIRGIFRNGADKICINTELFKNINLLNSAVKIFGSQSVNVLIQYKKIDGNYEVFSESGRERTRINLTEWVKEVQNYGAGEIFLISIDNDGVESNIEYEILKKISSLSKIPILYGGSINNIKKIEFLKKNNFSGAIISKSLHANKFKSILKYL